jgi:O-antigen/teichoic acid export membrane protein
MCSRFFLPETWWTLSYILPDIGVSWAVAFVCAIIFVLLADKAVGADGFNSSVPIKSALSFSIPFATFGCVLGLLVGATKDTLVTTVLTTLSSLATSYLALIYGKDTFGIARSAIIAGITAFLVCMPMSIYYARSYPLFHHDPSPENCVTKPRN